MPKFLKRYADSLRDHLFIYITFHSAAVVLLTIVFGACSMYSVSTSGASTRIVGGNQTTVSAWPSIVSLVMRKDWNGKTVHSSYWGHYCTGTLLTKQYVITAKHCLLYGPLEGQYDILIGRSNLLQNNQGERIQSMRSYIFPGWDPNKDEYNDLAGDWGIVRLSRPARRGKPLGLHRLGGSVPEGALMSIAGWGFTEKGRPSQLQEAQVPRMNDEYCQAFYPRTYHWHHYHFVPGYQMCAGYPGGGADSCMGDSGGPLMYQGDLVGVVSWGPYMCGSGEPGVYVRTDKWKRKIRKAIRILQKQPRIPEEPPVKEKRGWKPRFYVEWAVTSGEKRNGVFEHSVSVSGNRPIFDAQISHKNGEPLCRLNSDLFNRDENLSAIPDDRCSSRMEMDVVPGRETVIWSGWSPRGCPIVVLDAKVGGRKFHREYRSCETPELAEADKPFFRKGSSP